MLMVIAQFHFFGIAIVELQQWEQKKVTSVPRPMERAARNRRRTRVVGSVDMFEQVSSARNFATKDGRCSTKSMRAPTMVPIYVVDNGNTC